MQRRGPDGVRASVNCLGSVRCSRMENTHTHIGDREQDTQGQPPGNSCSHERARGLRVFCFGCFNRAASPLRNCRCSGVPDKRTQIVTRWRGLIKKEILPPSTDNTSWGTDPRRCMWSGRTLNHLPPVVLAITILVSRPLRYPPPRHTELLGVAK